MALPALRATEKKTANETSPDNGGECSPHVRPPQMLAHSASGVMGLSGYRLGEHLDRREVCRSGYSMPATRSERSQPDLVDTAEIRVLHRGQNDDFDRIELVPVHPRESHFDTQELAVSGDAAITYHQAPSGELDHGVQCVNCVRPDDPAQPSEAGQVHVVTFVTQRHGH